MTVYVLQPIVRFVSGGAFVPFSTSSWHRALARKLSSRCGENRRVFAECCISWDMGRPPAQGNMY